MSEYLSVPPEVGVEKTEIGGLFILRTKLYSDQRGWYQEKFRTKYLSEILGKEISIAQEGFSFSVPGVLRGLHAEPIIKIATPLTGVVFVAIADIRPDSPTFGKAVTCTIDRRDQMAPLTTLIIDEGLANSFVVTDNEPVMYHYAQTDVYKGGVKRAVRWNDPVIAIPWPIENPLLSDDDRNKHPYLSELFPEKFT